MQQYSEDTEIIWDRYKWVASEHSVSEDEDLGYGIEEGDNVYYY